MHLCSRVVAFDVGNRLWDGRRPQDGHMMEMSYRCCCAAAGMVFLSFFLTVLAHTQAARPRARRVLARRSSTCCH